jgi:hypothetical protein
LQVVAVVPVAADLRGVEQEVTEQQLVLQLQPDHLSQSQLVLEELVVQDLR